MGLTIVDGDDLATTKDQIGAAAGVCLGQRNRGKSQPSFAMEPFYWRD